MTVVAAVDRSGVQGPIVSEGRKLADLLGTELRVVHVLGPKEFREIEYTSVKERGETVPVEEIRATAAEIAAEAAGVEEYEPVGLVGDAAEEVLAYTEEVDAAYVVVGGRRHSPVGKVLFGSVTQSILLGASCPVVSTLRADD